MPRQDFEINKDTILCMSLSHRPSNFGTRFHNFLYRELGLNFLYKAFASQDLEGAVRGIRALKIRGCAVSMPFKEDVIQYLDEIDPSAKRIGAVNTIVNEEGHLHAYNTDYIAVSDLLKKFDSSGNSKNQVLLLGSGGMAKAIACALFEHGYRDVLIVARNPKTGSELAKAYGFQYAETQPKDKTFKTIINVTPIGMTPNPENHSPFSDAIIENAELIFDAVAYPPETVLIEKARKLGKKTISGFEIQVIQAREQFELYTGKNPTDAEVQKAAAFARAL
jgi:shikimate dehydrogenase